MLGLLIYFLLFGILLISLVFFIISLCLYISAKVHYKRDPDSVKPGMLKTRKILLIVASVIWVVVTLIFVGILAMLYMAVAYM